MVLQKLIVIYTGSINNGDSSKNKELHKGQQTNHYNVQIVIWIRVVVIT